MEEFNILAPGIWFGDASERGAVRPISEEGNMLLNLCYELKSGNFGVRSDLFVFASRCRDRSVASQALRLCIAVCRHEDVEWLAGMSQQLDDGYRKFVIYAPHSLSPVVLPHLARVEFDAGGAVEIEDLETSIRVIVGESFALPSEQARDSATRFYDEWLRCDGSAYCYRGLPVFPGDLTKILYSQVIAANRTGVGFPLVEVPTLLSIWCGIKCPVVYGQHASAEVVENVVAYIRAIAARSWAKGGKYFYGHRVA